MKILLALFAVLAALAAVAVLAVVQLVIKLAPLLVLLAVAVVVAKAVQARRRPVAGWLEPCTSLCTLHMLAIVFPTRSNTSS